MKQQLFESHYREDWQQLESLLGGQSDGCHIAQFPPLYRRLCHQLALAKKRRYSQHLINDLNDLAMRCHHHLYRHNTRFRDQWLRFIIVDFPRTLRANASFIGLSAALFVLPLVILGSLCFANEDMIYSVTSAENVRTYESMYDKQASHFGRERDSGDDVHMFGFYIKNNIGISFQVFAGGILFCLGSIFFLIFNGIHIGAVAGYLARNGYGETFFPFVVGHGAFELTALVFSGAAGLKLGFALVDPGCYDRLTALRIAGRQAVLIVYGSTLMLVIAAFLEAFWSSSSSVAPIFKYGVGAIFWLLVSVYYCSAGKPRPVTSLWRRR